MDESQDSAENCENQDPVDSSMDSLAAGNPQSLPILENSPLPGSPDLFTGEETQFDDSQLMKKLDDQV